MKPHFQAMASCGQWANRQLDAGAALTIPGVAEPHALDILIKGFLAA